MNLNSGIPEITENTVSIHLYEGTWVDSKTRFRDKTFQFIYRVFGEKVSSAMKKAYRKIFN